ncbi:MAG: hypothetical protein Salg2KO_22430 [Salibacteraceae bacterium]
MTSLGIGVLTWRAPETLHNTLGSHAAAKIGDIVCERVVFVQEGDIESVEIAKSGGYRVETSSKNLGILGGFEALGNAMRSEYLILNENDFPIVTDPSDTHDQLKTACELLKNETAKIVMLRSRQSPGVPFALPPKCRKYFPPDDATILEKARGIVLRTTRPKKARITRARMIRIDNNAHINAPNEVVEIKNGWNLTTSRWQPWTNNPIMIKRDFFLDVIIPFANDANTTRRINGFKNFEVEMNCNWWRKQEFPIAQGPGLFTHGRIGYRGY